MAKILNLFGLKTAPFFNNIFNERVRERGERERHRHRQTDRQRKRDR